MSEPIRAGKLSVIEHAALELPERGMTRFVIIARVSRSLDVVTAPGVIADDVELARKLYGEHAVVVEVTTEARFKAHPEGKVDRDPGNVSICGLVAGNKASKLVGVG